MNDHHYDHSKPPHHHHTMHGHKGHDMPPHEHKGHNHHEMMIDDYQKRFWVSLILSVPVILFSPMVQEILGFKLTFPGIQYLAFLLSSVVFFYGGLPFLKGLLDEVQQRNPGMMTLIGVAISVAYIYSSAIVFGLTGLDFFWELVT